MTLRVSRYTTTTTTTAFQRPFIVNAVAGQGRFFTSDKNDNQNKKEERVETDLAEINADEHNVEEIMDTFRDTSYYQPLETPDYSNMTNRELEDSSTIPGWDLIHSPPKDRSVPRGALVGTVVSTKMQKTVNVAVDRYKIHAKYRKRLRYTKKFMAHDENEVANTGDLVMIAPCHRISKHKHFMMREIIRAKGQL
jgi:small subunit ribosomal protein S17